MIHVTMLTSTLNLLPSKDVGVTGVGPGLGDPPSHPERAQRAAPHACT